uniref:Uncharacterized protein n=1 Tax=Neogobius melanostomus TaxID=47308 RepID=A0A8C6T6X3_9GOBI
MALNEHIRDTRRQLIGYLLEQDQDIMAAQEDDWKKVECLLQNGAQIEAGDEQNKTALFYAVAKGHEKTIKALLEAGAKVDNKLGRTALHWVAVAPKENAIVNELLSAKVNVNALDNEKRSALHLAAMEGKLLTVASLLSHKGKAGAKDKNVLRFCSFYHLVLIRSNVE